MTALALAERALAVAGARSAEVVVHSESSVFARFAGAEIHQPTLIDNALVQLTVFREGRRGFAVTNRGDDGALRDLAARADEAAAAAAPDPATTAPADAFIVQRVEGFDASTAVLSPNRATELAASAIDAAVGFGVYG